MSVSEAGGWVAGYMSTHGREFYSDIGKGRVQGGSLGARADTGRIGIRGGMTWTRTRKGKMTVSEAGKMGGEKTAETHGPEFYQDIGHKGGQTTSDTHGKEFYEDIGQKGGQATSDTHGKEFYQDIGQKGGQTTAETHGPDFYSGIGHKGGQTVRKLIQEGREHEEE
jgi:general stress protein YciG